VYELPTATILSKGDRHDAMVSLFASSDQVERSLGPLTELSERLPIPVRRGINNVRLRLSRAAVPILASPTIAR
jgi:hypothetical protein